MTKLSEAFKELCAVSRVRPDLAAGSIEDAARRLWRVLGEYPEAVALKAMDQWPRRSEWFPAEKELRELLREIDGDEAYKRASEGDTTEGVYLSPIGNTHLFVERVRQICGADFVRSWLAGGVNCKFSLNTIYTTGVGADRLSAEFSDMAEQLGVTIKENEVCTRMLADYVDSRGIETEKKRGRR